jgi:hypothetical protein
VRLIESLRKNATLLLSGLVTAVFALILMRELGGEPLIQPPGDFGILIGAMLVTAFLIVRDIRESNGKPNS